MRALVLGLFWPALLFAQLHTGDIEDVVQTSDGESITTDSLEMLVSPVLKLQEHSWSSAGESLFSKRHVRFQSSVQLLHYRERPVAWNDTWARTRVTSYTGRRLQSDLLLVRRVKDPQVVDELHLTLAGQLSSSELRYVLGTYQFDWGLGALLSSSFGAARSFSHYRNTVASRGKGVVPRSTSREESWLRGAVVERKIGVSRWTLFGNMREWNADVRDSLNHLSGVLVIDSEVEIQKRDRVSEVSYGGAAELESKYVRIGLLSNNSRFRPVLAQAKDLHAFSTYLAFDLKGVQSISEFARSGSKTAWISTVSRGTENWCGAFYLLYSPSGYFAPRSQSPFSYGAAFTKSRVLGMRLGTEIGRYEFAFDLRSHSSAGAGPTNRQDEMLAGIYFDAAEYLRMSARLSLAANDNLDVERKSSSIRLEPVWTNTLTVSSRAEFLRAGVSNSTQFGNGSYLHLQVTRPYGRIRPGLRVASFNLKNLGFPLQVYEPTVSGAYPLETFSNNGSRATGWVTLDLESVEFHTKVAWTTQAESGSSTECAIAVTIHN